MARIRRPIQFSTHFNVLPSKLTSLGVFDPTLNVDTKLFIDPLLLTGSAHLELRNGELTYKTFFSEIIKLLVASKAENDIAWRTAYKRLRFREIKGTCLGYGAASINGSGFGPQLTRKIVKTAKEIVELGVDDPDLFIALPLLEDDVGPDLISDMTTNIIFGDLASFNDRVIKEIKVPAEAFSIDGRDGIFPVNPTSPRRTPVILVPTDILRDLPIASDWEDVSRVASENSVLRDKVNRLIGEIWKAKSRKDKHQIRKSALSSYEAFTTLLDLIHGINRSAYDQTADPDGLLNWRRIHETVAKEFPLSLAVTGALTLDSANKVVNDIIAQLKYLIEDRGLARELWHNGRRRNEKSVQRLFFAVADSYCKANNLDISPEVDTGTGEVDFKFSHGYDKRVLVEVKLSDNPKLIAGYTKQLETYKKSERTMKATYVVVDVGKMAKKDVQLTKLRNDGIAAGLPVSDIVFIDGHIKESASKL
jgi:hypothetical protein